MSLWNSRANSLYHEEAGPKRVTLKHLHKTVSLASLSSKARLYFLKKAFGSPTPLQDSRGLGNWNDLGMRPSLILFENGLSDFVLNLGELRAHVDSRSTFSSLSVSCRMTSSRRSF